jgi:small multidrug resistance family-3 protein
MHARGRLSVMVIKSIALFVAAALLEIGGAWLVWQGVREHRGWLWIGAGVLALGAYGFVAAFQPDANFGRVLAAYGGVFIAGSLLWGMVADGFRPDRWDVSGAVICLVGVGLIMYGPR